jgi:LuxR family transcriptional regulator, maltose regulon positive regulatory protein
MEQGTTGGPAPLLLPTKLFIPTLDPDVVERGRLLQGLNLARGGRLLLVSAPAGSGKTTLITAWLRQLDRPAGWVSLDAGDDDPLSFLSYVVEGSRSPSRPRRSPHSAAAVPGRA